MLYTLLFPLILNGTKERSNIMMYILTGFVFVSLLISLTVKEELKRTKYENEKKAKKSIQRQNSINKSP